MNEIWLIILFKVRLDPRNVLGLFIAQASSQVSINRNANLGTMRSFISYCEN